MTEEIIIDKEDKTKKHRNNEIDCLHFGCRKGESGNVLFWCDFYDDHCDNYTGCYYRKYLRLEQENEKLKKEVKQIGSDFIKKGDYARELEKENKELKKDVQLFKCLDTFGESECHCACRCLGNEFCEDADKKINTYRSALEEIRNIILRDNSMIIDKEVYFEFQCGEPIAFKLQKIFNLINEVLQ